MAVMNDDGGFLGWLRGARELRAEAARPPDAFVPTVLLNAGDYQIVSTDTGWFDVRDRRRPDAAPTSFYSLATARDYVFRRQREEQAELGIVSGTYTGPDSYAVDLAEPGTEETVELRSIDGSVSHVRTSPPVVTIRRDATADRLLEAAYREMPDRIARALAQRIEDDFVNGYDPEATSEHPAPTASSGTISADEITSGTITRGLNHDEHWDDFRERAQTALRATDRGKPRDCYVIQGLNVYVNKKLPRTGVLNSGGRLSAHPEYLKTLCDRINTGVQWHFTVHLNALPPETPSDPSAPKRAMRKIDL